MKHSGWRIALITTVPPVAAALVPVLRELGHDPVSIVSARRRQPAPAGREPMGDETAPEGLDVLLAHDKWSVEPLLRSSRPDLALCWGFPWRIPQAALDVPRLGSINCHPALLPRHRGPIPLAWAFRDGDGQFGVTWHRMDAQLDTGAILAQAPVEMRDDDFSIEVVGPRIGGVAMSLLPTVLARIAAGDPGDPQPSRGGHLGGPLRRGLRHGRLVAAGAEDPRPGAGLGIHLRPVAGRRPGRRAERPPGAPGPHLADGSRRRRDARRGR